MLHFHKIYFIIVTIIVINTEKTLALAFGYTIFRNWHQIVISFQCLSSIVLNIILKI